MSPGYRPARLVSDSASRRPSPSACTPRAVHGIPVSADAAERHLLPRPCPRGSPLDAPGPKSRVPSPMAEISHQVEPVTEATLVDLLPLVRDYCECNGVDPSDQELLAVSRALIADPAHEGIQYIARDSADRAAGFASLFWSWATW